MTGLSPGLAAPILRGHPQNFVFMITLLLLLLLLLLLSLLFARRLINTMSSTRGFAIVSFYSFGVFHFLACWICSFDLLWLA